MPALPTYKPPSYLSGVSGLCSLLFTDSTSSLIGQYIPFSSPSIKPEPCLPKFSLHLQFLTRTQVRKWVLKWCFLWVIKNNDIHVFVGHWQKLRIQNTHNTKSYKYILCYLKISLWHGVTPVKPLKKENLTLSVNCWVLWYVETPSSFVVWHESATISLHQFQTPFWYIQYTQWYILMFICYPKLTNNIHSDTTITATFCVNFHFGFQSVALCLGSKLCCGWTYSQLLAGHTAATS